MFDTEDAINQKTWPRYQVFELFQFSLMAHHKNPVFKA